MEVAFKFTFDHSVLATDFTFYIAGWPDDDFGVAKEFTLDGPVDANVAFRFDSAFYYCPGDQAVERMGTRGHKTATFSFTRLLLVVTSKHVSGF